MAFCIGPFCGKFRDELGGDTDSEEDEDGSSMRAKSKRTAKRRRPKKERNVASAAMMWAPYLSEVRVLVKGPGQVGEGEMKAVTQLKTPYNQSISDNMLARINQLQQVEIIEIAKCNLDRIPPSLEQVEGLMTLCLSYNNIRKFSNELGRCDCLERVVLDWNQISEIEPGIFSESNFPKLEVINLSHNRLAFLPSDFPKAASQNVTGLQYVDLSYNQLTSVPAALMQCRSLKELNLSHNKMRMLPEEYGLNKLKKLFLSFNELSALPTNIGTSKELEKLRITSNQIKKLPYSILKLWKKEGGKLEELLVDRNPLQVPSITAFEMEAGMGGMDRAFHLLQESKLEQELAEQKQLVTDQLTSAQQVAALPAPAAPVERKVESTPSEYVDEHLDAWYFGHCVGEEAKIRDIRDAEQSFLVKKRHTYLAMQRKIAESQQEASKDGKTQLTEQTKAFLDEKSYQNYRGRIHEQDIDLFFILFVFAAKPMYKSAQTWFDKFEIGDKGFMSKQEWYELCLNSPLDVRQKMMDDLWNVLFDSSVSSHGLTEPFFIAACQIHDLEARDPYIERMADALCLDYYDNTISEIEAKLAPSRMEFGVGGGDGENTKSRSDALSNALEDPTGLKSANQSAAKLHTGSTYAANEVHSLKDILKKVSLTDYDIQQVSHLDGIEEGSDAESEKSRDSAELSDDENSEMSEFDAQAFLQEEEQANLKSSGKTHQRFAIGSDASLKQLMEAPLQEIFRGRRDAMRATEVAGPYKRQVIIKPQRNRRQHSDELAVRRALRDVYRSMPFLDFSAFISFLLRTLHSIKEDKNDRSRGLSCSWHDDDPSFRHAVGAAGLNKYTCRLLEIMGFVHLNNICWIWPTVHLKSAKHGKCWGHLQVPLDCPGLVKARLERMIQILTQCLVAINNKGPAFTGYFETD
ncbi:lrrc39 [Symbiodinium natans]|uniref:Lrrc39 protein n=1 Tax=Symbiodinium natans TaxID=878477 RepID=A0A812UFR0_9DINO|nr:lrrc39 [Symbiodinium natans]